MTILTNVNGKPPLPIQASPAYNTRKNNQLRKTALDELVNLSSQILLSETASKKRKFDDRIGANSETRLSKAQKTTTSSVPLFDNLLANNASTTAQSRNQPPARTTANSLQNLLPVKPNAVYKGPYLNGFYEGQWKENTPHGQGTLTIPNETVYRGRFTNGMYHGPGKITCINGAIYAGLFKNNMFHGQGKSTTSEGAVYEGEFQNNLRHGQGMQTLLNGTVYKGQYINNMRHGQGELILPDGTVYKGEFENNARHGQGELTLPNGTVKKGIFVNGLYQETSATITTNSTPILSKSQHLHPRSIGNSLQNRVDQGHQEASTRPSITSTSIISESQNPNAVRTTENSLQDIVHLPYLKGVYRGQWKNSKPEGRGEFVQRDGFSYKGLWKNGKPEGQGCLTTPEGKAFNGLFKNGIHVIYGKL